MQVITSSYKLLLMIVLCLWCHTVQAEKIQFLNGEWDAIVAEAQLQGKPIFVEAYANYCVSCRFMAETIFSDREVADFFNENFVNYKADIMSPSGEQFKNTYNVYELPDLLFFSADGELLFREKGSKSKAELMEMARGSLQGYSYSPTTVKERKKEFKQEKLEPTVYKERETVKVPVKRDEYERQYWDYGLVAMEKYYYSGFKKPNFLYEYALMLKTHNKDYSEVANLYLRKQRMRFKNLKADHNMRFIYHTAHDINTNSFDYLIGFKSLFIPQYGQRHIEERIADVLLKATADATNKQDKKQFKRGLKLLKKGKLRHHDQVRLQMKTAYYEGMSEWGSYASEINRYLKKSRKVDPAYLYQAIWKVLRNSNQKSVNRQASNWAKRLSEIDNSYYHLDAYAQTLYKAGKNRKATQVAVKAISKARNIGLDANKTEQLLAQIKNGF